MVSNPVVSLVRVGLCSNQLECLVLSQEVGSVGRCDLRLLLPLEFGSSQLADVLDSGSFNGLGILSVCRSRRPSTGSWRTPSRVRVVRIPDSPADGSADRVNERANSI